MKTIFLFFLSFAIGAPLATANIVNLPAEIESLGDEDGSLLRDVADEMSYTFDCDLSAEKLLSLKAEIVLTDGELQDPEYQEYEGEFSSFKLITTVKLPNGCNKKGTYTCSSHFDLYDSMAYELDRAQTSCEKG